MKQSRVGEKRPRDTGANNDALRFISGLTLSQHPFEQRKGLFMKKLKEIIQAKSLHPTQFEGYTIRERFKRMGWEALLNIKCEKIYRHVVVQWTASLSKKGDELTGFVDGKPCTITPKIIRDILGVDTRTDLPYVHFNEADFEVATDENRSRWVEACKTVFGLEEKAKKRGQGYDISKMTPLVQILWQIGVSTFHPRNVDIYCFSSYEISVSEMYLLHALFTGDYLYSFAHLMIDDIWNMYEHEHRRDIPHGHYISEILDRLGAVSEDEYVEHVSPEFCIISRKSLIFFEFSESPTEYIIDNWKTGQRVTFLKKFMKTAKPHPTPQSSQSTYQYMPPVLNPNVDMTKLFSELQKLSNEQSSKFQKLLNEMKTDMQKQTELQALEAQRREQERARQEQLREQERMRQAEEREQERVRQSEKREQEREKRTEERERQSEKREREREKRTEERERQAEEREREREKRGEERERKAKIRADAIIWDIERQRYFYEKEQDQLRMAWNQVTGADEFQFPLISRTSLHPPRQGSQYSYDPTQGDEIPKAFQSIFKDIYGPIHKESPSP